MNTERVIWGLILVFLGGILLLENFGVIDFYWSSLWVYWPLFLILLGANMLFSRSNTSSGGLVSIILTVCVLVFLGYAGSRYEPRTADSWRNYGQRRWNNRDTERSNTKSSKAMFSEKYSPDIQTAVLNISGGATSYTLNHSTNNLFDANVKQGFGHFSLQKIMSDDQATLNFKIKNEKGEWSMDDAEGNEAKISLNKTPFWDINIKVGAGNVDFDLSPFKVKKLNFEGGAASVEAKLGDLQDTTLVTVRTGAAEVKLSVPESSGCRINVSSGLSSSDFDGFTKQPDGSYTTSNYASSAKKIIISFKGGLSDFSVDRY